jgi:hypothetical protein
LAGSCRPAVVTLSKTVIIAIVGFWGPKTIGLRLEAIAR